MSRYGVKTDIDDPGVRQHPDRDGDASGARASDVALARATSPSRYNARTDGAARPGWNRDPVRFLTGTVQVKH